MRAQEAVTQVNRTKFKPGWRPVAQALSETSVRIGFEVDTVDTSYRAPDGTLTKPIHVGGPVATISVAGYTEEMLDYALLKVAARLDEHENREFLARRQPDGTWKASLHPHTYEGEMSWAILKEADEYLSV